MMYLNDMVRAVYVLVSLNYYDKAKDVAGKFKMKKRKNDRIKNLEKNVLQSCNVLIVSYLAQSRTKNDILQPRKSC